MYNNAIAVIKFKGYYSITQLITRQQLENDVKHAFAMNYI